MAIIFHIQSGGHLRIVILVLSITISIFAQIRISNQLFVYPQSLNIDSYNSIGFSNLNLSTASDISSANPASLYQFENISFGLNYTYISSLRLIDEIKLSSSKEIPPITFSFIYPINNFRVGLAYHQKYNNYLEFDEMEVATIENPEGTGEYFNATSERIIHSPSLLFDYTFKNVFTDDKLSMGLQLFWDFLKIEEKIYKTKGKLEGNNFSWKLGVLYEYDKKIYISCLYEKENKLEGKIEIDDTLTVLDIDVGSGQLLEFNPQYFLKLPDKLAFGITVKPMDKLILSTSVSSVFWEGVNDRYRNNLDLSISTIYKLYESIMISLGFYNTDLNNSASAYYYESLDYNSSFIGLGINWQVKNFDIQCEFLDNKLFASKISKQTQVKIGIDFTYN